MATTAGDIYLRSGASGSFVETTHVQGGWKTVPSASDMYAIYHDRLSDGQIIWVESQSQLYLTRKFVAFETPGYGGSDNSASFSTTNLGISGGGGGGETPAGTVSSSAQTVANLVGQDLTVGSLTAETYIVSSSVTHVTTSFSSGSTVFGDDINDTHVMTGSLLVSGSISFTGEIDGGTF